MMFSWYIFCLYGCAAQIGPPSICCWVLPADECQWKYIDNARPEIWYSCQRRQIVFQSMVIFTSSFLFRYCCFGLFYLNRTKWCLSQFEVAVCGNKGKVNRILKDQQRSWKSVYQRKNPNLAEKEVKREYYFQFLIYHWLQLFKSAFNNYRRFANFLK